MAHRNSGMIFPLNMVDLSIVMWLRLSGGMGCIDSPGFFANISSALLLRSSGHPQQSPGLTSSTEPVRGRLGAPNVGLV